MVVWQQMAIGDVTSRFTCVEQPFTRDNDERSRSKRVVINCRQNRVFNRAAESLKECCKGSHDDHGFLGWRYRRKK